MWMIHVQVPLCLIICCHGRVTGGSKSRVLNNHKPHTTCDVGPCAQALSDISAFPGERRYIEGTLMYNPLHSKIQPAFVAFPISIEDLQRCLKCAYEYLVPFTVKSGGHGSEGYSTIDGSNNGAFVINLGEMKQVIVDKDSETVRVQTGAKWEDVYDKIDDSKYIVIGGICPTVGVSGFTLGGGYSFLSRYFGLTIDNTLSFTMVTANGSSVVVANTSTHTDLYWALRGGGGGNFGIVVDFTFRIHPVVNPTHYVYAAMVYNSSSAEVLEEVLESISEMRQFYVHVVLLPGGEIQLYLLFIEREYYFTDFSSVLQPILDNSLSLTLKQYTSYLELFEEVGNQLKIRTAVTPHPTILKGCILDEFPLVKITSDKNFNIDIPETCVIVFNHLGGAISDIAPTDTAYYHRNAPFEFYTPCYYRNKDEKKIVWEFEMTLLHMLKTNGYCIGSYVNDMDRELRNWQVEYYGGNYQRLVEIQERWNPLHKGTFHFLQEIGSHYNP